MNSKTIILSSQSGNNSGRGIISIYIEDDLLKCKLRLYNIPKLSQNCKLGIYHNKQVYSANLLEKNGAYESSFVGEFDLNENFYIALINTQNNNEVIISGGTYAGFYFNNDEAFTSTPTTNLPTKEQIKEPEQPCAENNWTNCENCIYKQHFYSTKQTITTEEESTPTQQPKTENIEQPKAENLNTKEEIKPNMQNIINQFNYVFETYPQNEEINSLLPNGKFVKINENQEEYSIGVIYNNEKIKYLCYAVKSTYNTPAPQEIGEHYQWLPLDTLDPLSDGYYIVFQDTEDLKILDLN